MQQDPIYLSPPSMSGNEFRYLYEAFHSNWIAPLGKNVDEFEHELCRLTGTEAAAALSSGTAAVFLGLKALGVSSGDTVFCSDLTFAASCFPIRYLNADPVFIDCEPETCNMSAQALEAGFEMALEKRKLPAAVVIVDLYGNPAKFDRLLPLCRKYHVPVLEDSAEALGSLYNGKNCGTFGDIGVFSFNGNKIITTSGGGAAVSSRSEYIEKIRYWSTQSREPKPYYEHRDIGYNFRLSNICAAIGRGQLEALEEKIQKRQKIHRFYEKRLSGYPLHLVPVSSNAEPNCWLSAILLDRDYKRKVPDIIHSLSDHSIESRHLWKPMHEQPVFRGCPCIPHENWAFFNSSDLFERGVCLPSGDALTEEQLSLIVEIIQSVF